MSQEARFLKSREARAAVRQNKRQSHHEELHDFWTSLRHDLRSWESRLDALVQQKEIKTASQRTECTEKLDLLLKELQALRRTCLSCTDVPELPPADVRLLHQEFTTRATRLDQVREQLIPPSKFTFKRYRAAMQQNVTESESTREAPITTVSNAPIGLSTLAGNVIQDYHDATLVLDSSGSLMVQIEGVQERIIRQAETQSSSLLLQNLQRCQVTINGNYKALHIQNIEESLIRVVNAMDGALHVTACRNLEVYASCHQLRMHESSSLTCHVTVGSGPILEDCTGIVFYANEDLVYDTKDFNWLRNGVPSPNFCIVEEQNYVNKTKDECKVDVMDENNVDNEASSSAHNPDAITVSVEFQSDEDDDDEL